ncbi:hypothetical protein LPJ61_005675 [Coemansia biformis]|uniref:Lysozyme-like protein n=1 Tax=Coemansia biformis TaxID=1286918 RepID=A0A9W8CTK1_9FUNG|nr:hypothetical protein LPJ61_005675 [Coemansia biformis]
MKLATLSVGLVAAISLLGSAAGAPASSSNPGKTDSTCAYRIGFQLISYMNTGMLKGGEASCTNNNEEGYRAGIGLFTTKYGSVLAVVNEYMKSPDYKDEFKDVIEQLKKTAAAQSGPEGLDTFCDAWSKAALNAGPFFDAQVTVLRSMYEAPALKAAKGLKIRLPLTKAAMTQAALTNGLGNDGKTIGAVITATNKKFDENYVGPSDSTLKVNGHEVDEIEWLKEFLNAKDVLADKEVQFSDVFRSVLRRGYFTLSDEIEFKGLEGKDVSIDCSKFTAAKPPAVPTELVIEEQVPPGPFVIL